MSPTIWITLTVALFIIEMFTLDLVLLMLAGGALAGAITSLVGVDSWEIQALTSLCVALVLLLVVRKRALKRLRKAEPESLTNINSIIGKRGPVLTTTTAKLDGEVWTIRAADNAALPQDSTVEIVAIEGATAIVKPVSND